MLKIALNNNLGEISPPSPTPPTHTPQNDSLLGKKEIPFLYNKNNMKSAIINMCSLILSSAVRQDSKGR